MNKRTWYAACTDAASLIRDRIPEHYRSRTFSGIIGDIKALPPRKALSLISRRKGLGAQYAWLYLTRGIDGGFGYQACAMEALEAVLGDAFHDTVAGGILDVGCAVGVTAGVLGCENVTGFDLFVDLLLAAELVDERTGRSNRYIAADMTRPWPFRCRFDTVVCGLVCHHLKDQPHVVRFFSEANRVLNDGGRLVLTLPAGSIARSVQLDRIIAALWEFGFETKRELSGLALSTDSGHSVFWEFVIIAEKREARDPDVFISADFGFHTLRTPVTREEKGAHARERITSERRVRHDSFALIPVDVLLTRYAETVFVFDNIAGILKDRENQEGEWRRGPETG